MYFVLVKFLLTYLHKASHTSSEVQGKYDESECKGLCHIQWTCDEPELVCL